MHVDSKALPTGYLYVYIKHTPHVNTRTIKTQAKLPIVSTSYFVSLSTLPIPSMALVLHQKLLFSSHPKWYVSWTCV